MRQQWRTHWVESWHRKGNSKNKAASNKERRRWFFLRSQNILLDVAASGRWLIRAVGQEGITIWHKIHLSVINFSFNKCIQFCWATSEAKREMVRLGPQQGQVHQLYWGPLVVLRPQEATKEDSPRAPFLSDIWSRCLQVHSGSVGVHHSASILTEK